MNIGNWKHSIVRIQEGTKNGKGATLAPWPIYVIANLQLN